MNYKVSAKRHLAKTVSYRILSTGLGFLIMWYVTGSVKIGAAFGVAEMLLKPALYYLHERTWYRWITFGLVPEKESKKKTPLPTDDKVKTEIKVIEDIPLETPSPSPTPKTKAKKVLNYSSNR